MPTIKRFHNFNITMYFDDHGVPHFHVISSVGKASIAIDDLSLLVGELPSSMLKEARAWARDNKTLLNEKWEALSK